MEDLVHSIGSVELIGEAVVVLSILKSIAHIGIQPDRSDERCQHLSLKLIEYVTARQGANNEVTAVLRGLLVVHVIGDGTE